MKRKGFVSEFKDVWMLDGMRTPMAYRRPAWVAGRALRCYWRTLNMFETKPRVIPAKAGIQCPNLFDIFWIPAFAGMTSLIS